MRWSILILCVVALAGCRRQKSDDPPIHPIPDMDVQQRYDPQETNTFFADGRADRPWVAGTQPRELLKHDSVFYHGREADGSWVWVNPRPITPELLERGRERYDIFCQPCHGRVGDGKGVTITAYAGMVPPPSYHEQRLRDKPDGEYFDNITNGIRTMKSYRHQLSAADRWAIVAYIRALQRSQQTAPADVPRNVLQNLEVRQ